MGSDEEGARRTGDAVGSKMGQRGPGKGADREVWKKALDALSRRDEVPVLVALASPGRSARRAVAAALDSDEGRDAKEALVLSVGGEARITDPAERLLRWAMGREESARERTNPIARNEPFLCAHCGFEVPAAPGSSVRNHCSRCLRSQHVDGAVPGDRESSCRGLMDPYNPVVEGGVVRVTFRCRACGFERVNRLYPDWAVEPDRVSQLW